MRVLEQQRIGLAPLLPRVKNFKLSFRSSLELKARVVQLSVTRPAALVDDVVLDYRFQIGPYRPAGFRVDYDVFYHKELFARETK